MKSEENRHVMKRCFAFYFLLGSRFQRMPNNLTRKKGDKLIQGPSTATKDLTLDKWEYRLPRTPCFYT